jgi:hypothetical protein
MRDACEFWLIIWPPSLTRTCQQLLTRRLLLLLLLCTTIRPHAQVLQYGSIHSAVATLSSLQSAADLSAAIAAAPSQAALQSLAAEAAAIPQQSWLAQEYKVGLRDRRVDEV